MEHCNLKVIFLSIYKIRYFAVNKMKVNYKKTLVLVWAPLPYTVSHFV